MHFLMIYEFGPDYLEKRGPFRSEHLRLAWESQARGEMVGEFPGLATLDDDDNLRNTSDFRGVYCALLEQWLGVDAGPIIPNASSFTRPALVAA